MQFSKQDQRNIVSKNIVYTFLDPQYSNNKLKTVCIKKRATPLVKSGVQQLQKRQEGCRSLGNFKINKNQRIKRIFEKVNIPEKIQQKTNLQQLLSNEQSEFRDYLHKKHQKLSSEIGLRCIKNQKSAIKGLKFQALEFQPTIKNQEDSEPPQTFVQKTSKFKLKSSKKFKRGITTQQEMRSQQNFRNINSSVQSSDQIQEKTLVDIKDRARKTLNRIQDSRSVDNKSIVQIKSQKSMIKINQPKDKQMEKLRKSFKFNSVVSMTQAWQQGKRAQILKKLLFFQQKEINFYPNKVKSLGKKPCQFKLFQNSLSIGRCEASPKLKFNQFQAILNFLVEYNSYLIFRLFQQPTQNVYYTGLWICKKGKWMPTYVPQDQISLDKITTRSAEKWPCAIYKAMVKCFGSQKVLHQCSVATLMRAITGSPCLQLILSQDKKDKHYKLIKKSLSEGQFMLASKKSQSKLMGVKTLARVEGIRSTSQKEHKNIQIQLEGQDGYQFSLQYNQFLTNFSKITGSPIKPHFFSMNTQTDQAEDQISCVPLELFKESKLYVSIIQTHNPYYPLRLSLYRVAQGILMKKIGETISKNNQETIFQCKLSKGVYGLFIQFNKESWLNSIDSGKKKGSSKQKFSLIVNSEQVVRFGIIEKYQHKGNHILSQNAIVMSINEVE